LEFLIPPVPHVVFSLFFGNSAADSRKSGTCPIKKEASKSGCQEGKWENTKSENMLFSGQLIQKNLADRPARERGNGTQKETQLPQFYSSHSPPAHMSYTKKPLWDKPRWNIDNLTLDLSSQLN